MNTDALRRLDRQEDGRAAAPVRIVHLGAGNFFRAHEAWYTEHAPDADGWGIAAFTGRSATVADQLAPQEGLYQLAVQAPDGDRVEVISSITAAHPAGDLVAWREYLASPQVVLVTSTVTEAGYLRGDDGGLDLGDENVIADRDALRDDPATGTVTTAPGRFVAGLLARREANGDDAPLTFVPCDNVPDNGEMVRRVVTDLAREVDPSLLEWIERNVTVATTMVDRITPRTTDEDRARVAEATGIDDPALVVTEPFAEWVLAGDFVARPAWEDAGARIVDDVRPLERRKLWMLNGSHSLMAYAATILGHETVSDAIGDETVRGWVEQWWDVAARHLDLPEQEIADYRAALIERYENPRIRHLLSQIAGDGSQKLPIRIVPALKADRAAGELPTGACRAIAAWICHLRGLGAPVADTQADELTGLVSGELPDAVDAVLGRLGLDGDDEVRAEVLRLAEELQELAR
ncbi:mannitol dehydrogenase family protein [Mobilicoccus massiliensis]|uniref:mannitol dehydrogenase family protein n=1 Tax=Mobilicoccus massiliensis TaxID=1522310 RepID=UPI00058B459F|nr:mannitol dehydrogenase family protein [Mobilicoccus massiliensis]